MWWCSLVKIFSDLVVQRDVLLSSRLRNNNPRRPRRRFAATRPRSPSRSARTTAPCATSSTSTPRRPRASARARVSASFTRRPRAVAVVGSPVFLFAPDARRSQPFALRLASRHLRAAGFGASSESRRHVSAVSAGRRTHPPRCGWVVDPPPGRARRGVGGLAALSSRAEARGGLVGLVSGSSWFDGARRGRPFCDASSSYRSL